MTSRKSLDDMTSDDLDQLYADLDRAETEAREWAEAESADAAAGSYAHRAEQAEAALDRVRALADRWENALAPDRAYARALRAALDEPTAPPICELPHQTIDEEDACEQQRLTDAAKDRP